MHAHADRDSRSVRRATAALFKRAGKKVVHEGIENFVLYRGCRYNFKVEGIQRGNPEARCKRCRVYGLKNQSLLHSLSLCNETASPVVVVSCYSTVVP